MCLCLLGAMEGAVAYDFAATNAEGKKIYYNILPDGDGVEVTYGDSDIRILVDGIYEGNEDYVGDIVIPETVVCNETTHTVKSIGLMALRRSDLALSDVDAGLRTLRCHRH